LQAARGDYLSGLLTSGLLLSSARNRIQPAEVDVIFCTSRPCRMTGKNHETDSHSPMKLTRFLTLTAVSLSLAIVASAKTVVEIAAGSPNHTTLVAAVKAAGLVDTLNGSGPFTIFAPTNEAFAKLPTGTVESLLKPENKAKLVAILTYHVVPAKVLAADVKSGPAPSVNGKELTLKADASGVTVNNAKVIAADLVGSNGVIHVIDTVILP
jgi:uncharacterized surface protein with fasciclin (FAS1) repeats